MQDIRISFFFSCLQLLCNTEPRRRTPKEKTSSDKEMISALRHGMRGKTNPDAPPEVTSSCKLAAVIPPLVAILRISLPVQAEEVKE
jgi:hypothetical protein